MKTLMCVTLLLTLILSSVSLAALIVHMTAAPDPITGGTTDTEYEFKGVIWDDVSNKASGDEVQDADCTYPSGSPHLVYSGETHGVSTGDKTEGWDRIKAKKNADTVDGTSSGAQTFKLQKKIGHGWVSKTDLSWTEKIATEAGN